MQSFIFGGNTGETPESIRRKRMLADALIARNGTPRSVGEGLSAIGDALVYRKLNKRADSAESRGREGANKAFSGILGGLIAGSQSSPQSASFPVGQPSDAPDLASSAGSGSGAPSGGDGSEIGRRLVSDLKRDFGLSDAQAAGIVGNLAHESGNFQSLQEKNPLVKGSRGGFGYAQWTGPRRRQFEQWVGSNKLDPSSYDANYGFLKHELQNTPESKVLKALDSAQDADSSAEIFSNVFLRPGIPHMENRLKLANQYAGSAANSPQQTSQTAPSPSQGADIGAITQALQNPFLSQGQRSIAQSLLQRQIQQDDPMRQLQIQKLQQEINRQPDRKVIKGADGRNYYQDTQEPVLPNVQPPAAPPKLYDLYDPESGLPYKAQFNPETGEFDRVGGVKAPSGTTLQVDPATGAVTFQQGTNVKPLTEGQSKDTVFATRAEGALKNLDKNDAVLTDLQGSLASGAGTLGNYFKSPEYQKSAQAGKEFLQAILRKDTGAAITPAETQEYGSVYLPQPGDVPEVIEQKRESRRRALEALKAGMPPAAIVAQEKALANVGSAAPAQAPAPAPAPQQQVTPGAIPDGVDPEVWEFMTPEEKALFQ